MSLLSTPDTQFPAMLDPPMPRRQSCDRCHEQKVRCFTNEHDFINGPGGILEAQVPADNGRFVAPFPCTRCKRAKATCIYSPQQRSGRPRLPRDTSSPPSRKRVRRTSRCSSSSTTVSPTSSPSSSPSTASANPSSDPATVEWNQYQPYAQPNLESQTHPLFRDTMTAATFDNGTLQLPEHPVLFEQWLPPNHGHLSTRMTPQTLPFSSPSTNPPISIPLLPLKSNATPPASSSESTVTEPPWVFHDTCTKSYPEQLTEINLGIYHLSSTLSAMARAPLYHPPSPAIHEVFCLASSLVGLVEKYNKERTTTANQPFFTMDLTTGIHSAMDASISLMISACHQSLLGAFEDICSSFLLGISAGMQQAAYPATTQPSTDTAQILLMTNLISHWIHTLEKELASLDMGSVDYSSDSSGVYGQQGGVDPSLGDFDHSPDHNEHGGAHLVSTAQMGQGGSRQKGAIFGQMERRQSRVRAQVKTIKHWIGELDDV
ncbi:hypothetical protein B0H66DRAFT_73287 [Apodospora peruviana]|uniref:Zn(2)-C6 fungal-type domain-containing protein n=1 Tax=Apodospora peruviana TaxID=516989 RepID=A0AAE0IT10_9PEZI|nr:hypothetical protein B0H66DRAFT_73287 [Apodospora peruviana]